jgi:hypothetical protein
LSNLISGNLDMGAAVILVEHVDVDAVGGCPVLVDLYEDRCDHQPQRVMHTGRQVPIAVSHDVLLPGGLCQSLPAMRLNALAVMGFPFKNHVRQMEGFAPRLQSTGRYPSMTVNSPYGVSTFPMPYASRSPQSACFR